MIALLTTPWCYLIDALVACGGLPFRSFDASAIGLPPTPGPYRLPSVSGGHTLLIVSGWLEETRLRGVDAARDVLPALRRRFARVIGVDHADPFMLTLKDEVIAHMDAVLKIQGMFLDRDLYRFVVGAPTPDGRWTEKTQPMRRPCGADSLRKVRLAPPCFLAAAAGVRRRVPRFYCPSPLRRRGRGIGDRRSRRWRGRCAPRGRPRTPLTSTGRSRTCNARPRCA